MTHSPKLLALAQHLEVEDLDDIEEDDESSFEYGRQAYSVYTDEEADEAAKDHIMESLWAFNADFIASHTVNGLSSKAIRSLEKMLGELCEDANDLVAALIEDMDHFVKDAISADGRGHFLSSYDSEEQEEEIEGIMYFIYKN